MTTYSPTPESLTRAQVERAPYTTATPQTNKRTATCRGFRFTYHNGCGRTLAPGTGLLHKESGKYMCPEHYAMRQYIEDNRPRERAAVARINDWLGKHALYQFQAGEEIDRLLSRCEPWSADAAEAILDGLEELGCQGGELLGLGIITQRAEACAEAEIAGRDAAGLLDELNEWLEVMK